MNVVVSANNTEIKGPRVRLHIKQLHMIRCVTVPAVSWVEMYMHWESGKSIGSNGRMYMQWENENR